MNKIKRCIAVMLSLIFALSVCSISASAAQKSVIIAANETYSLSDNMNATRVYISSSGTTNSANSTQRMRAQCHYRKNVLSGWVYDTRVFVSVGSSLSSNALSTDFVDTEVTWRLGLSPEVEEDKGVSGTGAIVTTT